MSIFNKSELKKVAKNLIEKYRPGWVTVSCKTPSISNEYIENLEARVKNMMILDIERHPTKGKRLMPN